MGGLLYALILDSGMMRGDLDQPSPRIAPFVPMYRIPLSPRFLLVSNCAGRGGISPPSYQVMRTGLIPARAGKSKYMSDAAGQFSSLMPEELASTLKVGLLSSLSAQKAGSRW